ncbi:MAG: Gfo/Idh/MocA family oxidoreductase [Candidatus Brocadiae bacterium]|nr:Gfo/Idh/MocA family oxidoreductase [Candidatus Brocadiia bacterium]
MAGKKVVNVGMIGCGFMGKAHSFGYRNVNSMWSPPATVVMKCICGTEPEEIVKSTAAQYGWQEYETDWRKMVERDDIDLVDISTPNFVHPEQAEAAAKAGKDIICEKPLANDLAQTRAMTEAVEAAGVKALCGFTYRQAPAVQLAKQMIEAGEIGEIRHFRAVYLQDWIMDPAFPLVWRLKKEYAGTGALGDLGAHITDMARFLVGDIAEVSATMETFVKERPVEAAGAGTALTDRTAGEEKGQVTVDDAVIWCARFADGALGTFEATRFAGGRKNRHAWEINGSKASLGWNFEDMNYLECWKDGEGSHQGFRKVLATHPDTPRWQAWWPDGHIIGYGECFVNEIQEMLAAIAEDRQPVPTFRDGLKCQAVLEAVVQSAQSKQWTPVPQV